MRGHDWINTLFPDEIILKIFRRLDSKQARDACSIVCKRWLSLERLSRTTLRIGASSNPDFFIHLLSTRFPNIKTIHIDERLSISLPVQLGRKRRKGINGSYFKLRSMFQEDLPDSEQFDSFCLSDGGLITLSDQFPALEHLSLIWCSNISSLGLVSLALKCSLLKSLDLQGCYVGNGGLAGVGKCCKQLEELNLRFCEGLRDMGLVELAEGSRMSLKTLGVAVCAKITDKSLAAVGLYCKALETLLLDSEFITDKSLAVVICGLRFEPSNRGCDSTEPQTTSMKIKPHRVLFVMRFGAVWIKKLRLGAVWCGLRWMSAHPYCILKIIHSLKIVSTCVYLQHKSNG